MDRQLLSRILAVVLVAGAAFSAYGASESELIAVLKSNAGVVEKCEACRQLRVAGTTESVAVLAALLGDELVGHAARYALEGMDYAEAGSALRDAIGKTSGLTRAGLIDSVGWRGDKAATGVLAGLLSDSDAAIATASATALGRIGGGDAERALAVAVDAAKGQMATAVCEALLECAERRFVSGESALAAGIYRKVMASAASGAIRSAAWRGLALCDSAGRGAMVVEALGGEDKSLRTAAATLVRQTADKRLIGACIGQWDSFGADAQVLLLEVISEQGDKGRLAEVVKACSSQAEAVRVAAIRSLGVLGDASNVRLLVERAAGGSPGEKTAASESLAKLKGAKVNQALASELKRGGDAGKVAACRALLARNASDASGALVEAAGSGKGAVRSESLKALRELGRRSDIDSLVELIFAVEPGQAGEVGKVLSSVARRDSVEGRCTAAILSKYKSARNDVQRVALLTALGGIGDEAGLGVLRESLKSGSVDVRYAAIKALSAWPNADAAEDLAGVAESAENPAHRVLALRGYVGLVDSSSLSGEQKLGHYRRALKLAEQDAEKRRVLSALGAVETVGAFETAASLVGDAGLKNEAALAACAIAEKIYASKGGQLKAGLERVVAAEVGEAIRQQAWDILGKVEQVKLYVTEWEVSGPYVQDGKNYSALFDIAFAPEIDGGAEAKWRPIPAGTDPAQPYYIDILKALDGGEQRVAYLRAKLDWPADEQVKLLIGTDDGGKIWVNGQLVHSNNIARPFIADQDSATANLKKGENLILMKITQNNLPWGASLKVEQIRPARPPKVGAGFRLHTINAESDFEAACAADINKDGKTDIFCGGFWYEAPSWKKHFVRDDPLQSDYHNDFANLPMDVDGDGYVDIVNAAYFNKRLFWLRNAGGGGEFEIIDIDFPGNMETAISADINGDGRLDILPNIGGSAAWYEHKADGSGKGGARWVKHDLPKEAAAHGVGAGDINSDGRCDIVAPGGWAEQGADGSWSWHGEFDLGSTSIPILVHDVDEDGDSDIIWGMGHNYGIFWLEQGKGGDGGRTWAKHEIDSSWSQPHFLLLADLDGDRAVELVTGKRYHAHNGHDPGGDDPLCVYYYGIEDKGAKWTRHVLHEGGRVGLGINTQAVDMDGDGDIDVIAPGKSGLYLFENLLAK